MLVHVTRWTDVQGEVARQIEEHLRTMADAWGDYGTSGRELRNRLRGSGTSDYEPTYAILAERRRRQRPASVRGSPGPASSRPSRTSSMTRPNGVKRINGTAERRAGLPVIHPGHGRRGRRREALPRPDPGRAVSVVLPAGVEDLRHPAADGPLVRVPARLPGRDPPVHHPGAHQVLRPYHPGQPRAHGPRPAAVAKAGDTPRDVG